VSSVQASLQLLSLALDRISFPLLAGVYRAPLASVDFSPLSYWKNRSILKSAVAALCFREELASTRNREQRRNNMRQYRKQAVPRLRRSGAFSAIYLPMLVAYR
jgi:hypothetical protein